MISIELNTLRLALKDNPGTGDTYVDFLKPDTGTLNGYVLDSHTISDPSYSTLYNREIVTVTIAASLQVASSADLNSRLVVLNSLLVSTRELIKTFRGNIPSSLNGNWFPGLAAVLTWQPYAGQLRYWNVLNGKVTRDGSLVEGVSRGYVQNITVSMVCEAKSRGDRVVLKNPLINPNFEPENGEMLGALPTGWSTSPVIGAISTDPIASGGPLNNSLTYSDIDTMVSSSYGSTGGYAYPAGYPKYCKRALSIGAGWSGTINSSVFYGRPYVVTMWVGFYQNGDNTAGHNIKIQMESGYTGTWVSATTLLTITTEAALALVAVDKIGGWYKLRLYVGPGAGATARLKFVSTNYGGSPGPRFYFTGIGLTEWDNSTLTATEPVEYLAGNWTANGGTFRVYGAQGDTDAPARMTIDRSNFNTSELTQQHFLLGTHRTNFRAEYPLYSQDLMPTTGATNYDSTGVIIGNGYYQGTATVPSSNQTSFALPAIPRIIDSQPRRHLALLYYASNEYAHIASVDILIANLTQNFPKVLPNTWLSASNYDPLKTDYRMVALGEMWYPTQPAASVDRQFTNQTASIRFNHSSYSTNTRIACIGVFLIPLDQFGLLEFASLAGAKGVTPKLTNEGTIPVLDILPDPSNTAFRLTGWDFMLKPGDNRFVFMALAAKDSTTSPPLLTPAASTSNGVSAGDSYSNQMGTPLMYFEFAYSPRYYLDI